MGESNEALFAWETGESLPMLSMRFCPGALTNSSYTHQYRLRDLTA